MVTVALGTVVFVLFLLALALVILLARHWLVPSTPIPIRINGERDLQGHFGQKLLHALDDGGVHLASACGGAGTCGLCRVRVLDGGGSVPITEQAVLGAAACRDGYRLACQLALREPLSLTLPTAQLRAVSWQASVLQTRCLSPLIHEIRLSLPAAGDFGYEPGDFIQVSTDAAEVALDRVVIDPALRSHWDALGQQHARVSVQQGTVRAYSLANDPRADGYIALLVRLAIPPADAGAGIAPGQVSSWLCTREPGDVVSVSGPYGDFHIADDTAELVFVGGGVGLAPLRAMIHEQLRVNPARPMSLWYGTRSRVDLFCQAEFDTLADRHEQFHWHVALSEPEAADDWQGAHGFIHSLLQRDFLDRHSAPHRCQYYLCGPRPMVDAVRTTLHSAGVAPDHIHYDDFGNG